MRASVRAGETLSLHVSTNPESKFAVDVYRMGYYGGAGGSGVVIIRYSDAYADAATK